MRTRAQPGKCRGYGIPLNIDGNVGHLAHQDPGQEEEGDAPCNEKNQITEEKKNTL